MQSHSLHYAALHSIVEIMFAFLFLSNFHEQDTAHRIVDELIGSKIGGINGLTPRDLGSDSARRPPRGIASSSAHTSPSRFSAFYNAYSLNNSPLLRSTHVQPTQHTHTDPHSIPVHLSSYITSQLSHSSLPHHPPFPPTLPPSFSSFLPPSFPPVSLPTHPSQPPPHTSHTSSYSCYTSPANNGTLGQIPEPGSRSGVVEGELQSNYDLFHESSTQIS